MKKLLIIPLLVALVALSSCGRHKPVVNTVDDNFVPVVVVNTTLLAHVSTLFTNAGIKVTTQQIAGSEETNSPYPPNSYTILVPLNVKTQAISLIRMDTVTNHYWLRVQF